MPPSVSLPAKYMDHGRFVYFTQDKPSAAVAESSASPLRIMIPANAWLSTADILSILATTSTSPVTS